MKISKEQILQWKSISNKFVFFRQEMIVKQIYFDEAISEYKMLCNYLDRNYIIHEYVFNEEQIEILINVNK